MPVSTAHLEGYRSYGMESRQEYARLITPDDPYVQIVAMRVEEFADENGWSAVAVALSLAQSIAYVADNVSTGMDEYPRFPLETLFDGQGDCEDKAVLYASIVISLGHDAALFLILSEELSHMATGVAAPGLGGAYVSYNGTDYFYAETTSPGARIGQVPEEIDLNDVEVLEPAKAYSPFATANAGDDAFEPFAFPALLYLASMLVLGILLGAAAVSLSKPGKTGAREQARPERGTDPTGPPFALTDRGRMPPPRARRPAYEGRGPWEEAIHRDEVGTGGHPWQGDGAHDGRREWTRRDEEARAEWQEERWQGGPHPFEDDDEAPPADPSVPPGPSILSDEDSEPGWHDEMVGRPERPPRWDERYGRRRAWP